MSFPSQQTILDLIKEAMLMNRDSSGYILVDFPETDTMQDLFMGQVKPPDKMVKVDLDSTVSIPLNLHQPTSTVLPINMPPIFARADL